MGKLDGSEQVLCTPASELARLGGIDGFLGDPEPFGNLLAHLLGAARWIPRTEALEADPTWLQVIPYGLLVCGGRVFAYRRAKAGQEARLHGRVSIGIGGHVNPRDYAEFPEHAVAAGLYPGLVREVCEEVRPGAILSVQALGLLHDPSNPVGAVHLGVVHRCELVSTEIEPTPEIEPIGWFNPSELLVAEHRWETWTGILLPYLGDLVESPVGVGREASR